MHEASVMGEVFEIAWEAMRRQNATRLHRVKLRVGALAGVVHAFLNLSERIGARLTGYEKWSQANNPFFEGGRADLLALIPLAALTIILYLVGRELLLKPKATSIRSG